MPELCRFHGIVIRIYHRDHAPPHFHAEYSGQEALVAIEGLAIVRGSLPANALRLIAEWSSLHQIELREAWERAQRLENPGKIAPLE